MKTIRSHQNDTLSSIAHQYYGSSQHIHTLLNANPQLCHHPALLPAGITIKLPPAQISKTHTHINLWD